MTVLQPVTIDQSAFVPPCDACGQHAQWAWTLLGPCDCDDVSLFCVDHHEEGTSQDELDVRCTICHQTLPRPWRLWVRFDRIAG